MELVQSLLLPVTFDRNNPFHQHYVYCVGHNIQLQSILINFELNFAFSKRGTSDVHPIRVPVLNFLLILKPHTLHFSRGIVVVILYTLRLEAPATIREKHWLKYVLFFYSDKRLYFCSSALFGYAVPFFGLYAPRQEKPSSASLGINRQSADSWDFDVILNVT